MTDWKTEICSEQPADMQRIGADLYMQRRNIELVHVEATDTMPAYDCWECESREITMAEYQMLKAIEDIDVNEALDEYTLSLIEEGLLA